MKALLALILLSLTFTCFAQKSLKAHVHGSVALDIAVEGKEVLFMLKGPSESFFGFEYKAKTKQEKAMIKKMESDWRKGALIDFPSTKGNGCKVKDPKFEQEFEGDSHSEVKAELYLKCNKPVSGSKITITLKQQYSRIQELKVQLIRHDGSVAVKNEKSGKFDLTL